MSTLAHRDGVRKQGEMWPSQKGRLCIKVISFRLLPVLSCPCLVSYDLCILCERTPGVMFLNVP